MTHKLDRGDIIDLVEEAVLKHTKIVVTLDNDHTFEDRVRELITQDGEDHVVFHDHETVLIRKIAKASRA